jgi:tRNA pseudouridine synthase 2
MYLVFSKVWNVIIVFSPRFKHPHSGKILEFSCPPPDDFSEVLDELRKVTSSGAQNGDGVV